MSIKLRPILPYCLVALSGCQLKDGGQPLTPSLYLPYQLLVPSTCSHHGLFYSVLSLGNSHCLFDTRLR